MNKYNYKSCLKDELNAYMNQRVTNGFDYQDSAYRMKRFDQFLVAENYNHKEITREIIEKWCIQKPTENKNTRNKRLSSVRGFCRYIVSINGVAYIPSYHPGESKKVPYVLNKSEIFEVFKNLDVSRIKATYHYNCLIPVIYRLYYCCGLRNNEACQLKLENIIHEKKALMIVETKNHKDRLVYLDDSMYIFLMKYIQIITKIKPSIWLFPSTDANKPIDRTYVSSYFHSLITKLNIGNKSHHPTVHSLRHTFVVHKIDNWIQEGIDINHMMPYLSKQLGHSSIEETFYYYHTIESSMKIIREKDKEATIYPKVEDYEEC